MDQRVMVSRSWCGFLPLTPAWIPVDSLGFLLDSYGFPLIPLDSYGFLWIPMGSHGFLWIPMGPLDQQPHGFLWTPMGPQPISLFGVSKKSKTS